MYIIISNNYKYTRVLGSLPRRQTHTYAHGHTDQRRQHQSPISSAMRALSLRRPSPCGCATITVRRQCPRAAAAHRAGGPRSPCWPSAGTDVCSRPASPAVCVAPPGRRDCCWDGAGAPGGTGGADGRGQRRGHPGLAGMRSLPGSRWIGGVWERPRRTRHNKDSDQCGRSREFLFFEVMFSLLQSQLFQRAIV